MFFFFVNILILRRGVVLLHAHGKSNDVFEFISTSNPSSIQGLLLSRVTMSMDPTMFELELLAGAWAVHIWTFLEYTPASLQLLTLDSSRSVH
jgi:hypothetical protein